MSAGKALKDPKAGDREPQTLAEVVQLLQQGSVAKGLDKLTDEEIDAIIASARREMRDRENQQ